MKVAHSVPSGGGGSIIGYFLRPAVATVGGCVVGAVSGKMNKIR
jgi:hypothetical protein